MRAERLAQQSSTNPGISDYDTDTANPTDIPPLTMAPPPKRTNTELNLSVLRRYVPDTERIISIAPFAVVYHFSPDTQQWEKSGIEGTLFVCQLVGDTHPRYNVIILNRKSLENFVTELVSEDDIEITEQYVILQVLGENGVPVIYGLWIFSDEGEGVHTTKDIVAGAIQECAMRAAHENFAGEEREEYGAEGWGLDGVEEEEDGYDVPVPAPVQQPPATGQSVDLLSLFNKPSVPVGQGQMPDQPRTASHFPSTADTDFFRSSNSPANHTQTQSRPPPAQDALLKLFKTAPTG